MVIGIAVPSIVNIAKWFSRSESRIDSFLTGKKLVLRSILEVEYMLHVVKRIIQNNYLIIGRNLLLTSEHKDRM